MSVEVGGTDSTYDTCAPGTAVAVSEGSHDIDLSMIGVLVDTSLNDGYLTVLWVPFDGDGEVPTP